MRKICFVTGTRAEYGLLRRVMKLVQDSPLTRLQIIATNMHLSPIYGETYKEIEVDGFTINEKIDILGDKKLIEDNDILHSMAKGLVGFANAYDRLRPDLIVILGDRYEMLSASTAALIKAIPIAHIHGGEVTEGAYDDAIRHSITKMSSLHFTSTAEYRKRVIQLGEAPDKVFYVGALGVENVKKLNLLSKMELEDSLEFNLGEKSMMVTYHPETLNTSSTKEAVRNLLDALDEFRDYKIIFTMPNSDNHSYIIRSEIEKYVIKNKERCKAFNSLGIVRYLSVLKYVSTVVGNSSSGIIEVPSFHIPTLNIGDRQKGRICANSIYNCNASKEAIIEGLRVVTSKEFREIALKSSNPY
ncbi:MAG: UDP-N-acetylglucosamine 2-epimerase (hydrolyzing), partial [Bacteroidales bacterium]|nr:UDP-N-acetylglucosamine 2-epimerase (hydrolyzing) [Bacteroidales bacterium]